MRWLMIGLLSLGGLAVLVPLIAIFADAWRDANRHDEMLVSQTLNVEPWVSNVDATPTVVTEADMRNAYRVDNMRGIAPHVDNGQRRRKTDSADSLVDEIESWMRERK